MSKLRYFYGTMASAKSSNLLMKAYQFEESGAKCLLLKPSKDDRVQGEIYSRIVPSRPCYSINESTDVRKLVYNIMKEENQGYDYIFVDEVQFLSKEQIKQLWRMAHKQNIDVFCYGLKNTYQNNLFPGSEQLLIMADTSEEIKSKCCYCGNKATTHLRFVNGKVETEGDLIKVDNNESRNNNEEYKSVCQDCWYERK